MALDATVAGDASNSYLTVAEADAFADADLGRAASKWATLDEPTKEKALRRATLDLDEHLEAVESRYSVDQALLFPRAADTDSSGSACLVAAVRRACYEQAAYVASYSDQIDDSAARRARGLTQFSDAGLSGAISNDPSFGLMAPRALRALQTLDAGAVTGWIETT